MKKTYLLVTSSFILSFAASIVPVGNPVFANRNNENSNSNGSNVKLTGRARAEQRHTQNAARADERNTTEQSVELAAISPEKAEHCKAREPQISSLLQQTADRSETQIATLDEIVTRVQKFYDEKGYTLDHYDTLIADVNQRHEEAEAALTALKDGQNSFSCIVDPSGELAAFRGAHQQKNDRLRAYKDSIKRLIVAIKSAQTKDGGQ